MKVKMWKLFSKLLVTGITQLFSFLNFPLFQLCRYYTVLPVIVAGDNENEINQIMIDNLSPFSRYQIFIRPIKKCDHSILSEKVFFTTSGKSLEFK